MRKSLLAILCFVVLDIAGPRWPPLVAEAAAQPPADDPAVTAMAKDYQAVRKVGLALSALGFLLAVSRLGMTEFPAERHRAESLAALTAILFVLLVGDRMIAQGVAGWFHLPSSSLPPFWR